MAIYHFSAQIISRGKGQSAVASASYRSGERLEDERTGEAKFYKREVKPETMILSPSNSPEWVNDRQRLWNEVEKIERRKDAQLAREFNVALPRELSNDQQRELIKGYVQDQFVDRGMVADISIHRDDKNNPHAHVMLTTREISENGFEKKNREWNQKELLEQWREQWSEHANKALEKANVKDRITHLSNKDRGLEVLPTVHLGHVAHEMESKGVKTERGTINAERQAYNAVVIDLQKYREEKKALEEKLRQNQDLDKITTPQEKISLNAAKNLLGKEPTIERIQEKLQALKKEQRGYETRLNKLDSLENDFNLVARLYNDNLSDKNNIAFNENENKKFNIAFSKKTIKEQRAQKEKRNNLIEDKKAKIEHRNQIIESYQDKLNFKTQDEFNTVMELFNQVKGEQKSSTIDRLNDLKREQHTLENAQKALENRFVRSVAQKYPNNPEMAYLDFETAKTIEEVSRERGGRTIPVDVFKGAYEKSKTDTERFKNKLNYLKQQQKQLDQLEHDYNSFKTYNGIVDKYEKSPLYQGKLARGMSMPREYDIFKSEVGKIKHRAKEDFGIENIQEYPKIKANTDKAFDKTKSNFEISQNFTNVLDGIIQGINQANQQHTNHNKKKQRKKHSRGHEEEFER